MIDVIALTEVKLKEADFKYMEYANPLEGYRMVKRDGYFKVWKGCMLMMEL